MRKLIFRCFFILIFLALVNDIFSQRFGGNPPSIKWKRIDTDTARIIFPEGLDTQAQRVSSLVHYLASQKPVALGDKLYKINIVLQNQTTIGNAYVGLGPFRSEFFLNPPPNNFEEGTIPWNDQLAIHEYRHVQQFNNFRTGLSKVMYILFGQEGFSLAINASVPEWYYEGDAVYNETVLSKQGRGRIPFFLNTYPSLWLAGKNYSWMKLRNGSLKDYVPNHYYLGYLLVNYGREKYGLDFWTKVTTDAAAFKELFYPFQYAIKKYAGVSYQTFRKDAFDYYKKLSSDLTQSISQGEDLQNSPIRDVFKVNKQVVTNYLFPYVISNDSLLYLKTSYNRRPTFYIKDSEREHILRIKDIATDEQFSYRNGKIVYAAYETDPRWAWQDYTVIKLLDINSNKQKTLRHKTKYFAPDISPSGEKIAAVHVATNGKSELHLISVSSGAVINSVKSSEISLFTDPKFIDDNSVVCVVRLVDGKSALAIADLSSGSIERLTSPSFNVAGYPCVNNGTIYFTASYAGNDDLFAVRLNDKKVFKITNGPLGNYFVNAANGKITWSAFTAEGYQLRQMDEKDIILTPVNETALEAVATKFPVSHSNEVGDILLNPLINRKFPVSKYSKGTGFLNFHSWRPYYEDPEYSFSIYGQNILNTTATELYYLYNEDEKTNAAGVNFTYGGLFPYLSLGTQYTFNRQRVINNKVKQWDQLDSRIGVSIPLNWISGKAFNRFSFGTNYVYRNDFNKGIYKDTLHVKFSYLYHFVSWSQQVETARQHIYPKLGYAITFNYRHAITNYKSWQPVAVANVYLPGVRPSHSIVLSGAFQETDTLNVLFGNRFPYSRGYNAAYFSRMWKFAANYHFPLVYPDFGVASILYLQRIRGNLFYDYTLVYSTNKSATREQRSLGGEMFIDTKWWNQYPLTFGFRVSRLLDTDFFTRAKGTVFEFILPVSIIPR